MLSGDREMPLNGDEIARFFRVAPGDSVKKFKLEIPLGDDASGWYGIGLDDIWEVRHRLSANSLKLQHAGVYKYEIRQIMRENPLHQVMSAGLRVQKIRD